MLGDVAVFGYETTATNATLSFELLPFIAKSLYEMLRFVFEQTNVFEAVLKSVGSTQGRAEDEQTMNGFTDLSQEAVDAGNDFRRC